MRSRLLFILLVVALTAMIACSGGSTIPEKTNAAPPATASVVQVTMGDDPGDRVAALFDRCYLRQWTSLLRTGAFVHRLVSEFVGGGVVGAADVPDAEPVELANQGTRLLIEVDQLRRPHLVLAIHLFDHQLG